MTTRSERDQRSAGTPSSMPEGTPSLASPTDHSFTLQAIMEMQKTVGVLCEKVDRLSTDITGLDGRIETFGDKLDKVRLWQARVSTGGLVVAGLAGLAWTLITFIPWDRVHFDTAPHAEVSSPPVQK